MPNNNSNNKNNQAEDFEKILKFFYFIFWRFLSCWIQVCSQNVRFLKIHDLGTFCKFCFRFVSIILILANFEIFRNQVLKKMQLLVEFCMENIASSIFYA